MDADPFTLLRHFREATGEGERDARLTAFLISIWPFLMYSAQRLGADETEAKEIASEASSTILRQLKNFRGASLPSLRKWCKTIVFGTWVDRCRKEGRNLIESVDPKVLEWIAELNGFVVSSNAEAPDDGKRVLALLAAMDEECRSLLVRHYYDDMPHAELAKELGVSVGAVRMRIYRCVQELSDMFFAS